MSSLAKPSTQTEASMRRQTREYHHGTSPAAWVGSMTALLGFVVGSIGFLLGNRGVIIAGFVVVGIALIATVILRSLGYGNVIGHHEDES